MNRIALVLSLITAFAVDANAVNMKLVHTGRILGADEKPVSGGVALKVAIFDAVAAGTQVWTDTFSVQALDGVYTIVLGDPTPLDSAALDGPRWIEVSVANTVLSPRMVIGQIPLAVRALTADTAENATKLGGFAASEYLRTGNGGQVGNLTSTGTITAAKFVGGLEGTADVAKALASNASGALPSGVSILAGQVTGSVANATTADTANALAASASVPASQIAGKVTAAGTADTASALASGASVPASQISGKVASAASADDAAKVGGRSASEFAGTSSSALLASFDFEETTGTSFADSLGNGVTATAASGGIAAGSTGHTGKAISFTGGRATIADGNSIPTTPTIFVESWIQPAAPLNVTRTIATRPTSWALKQVNAELSFTAYGAAAATTACTVSTTGATLVAGTWVHVSAWYNGLRVEIAVNGFVRGSAACANGPLVKPANNTIFIGAGDASGNVSEPYAGPIDEFRIRSNTPTQTVQRRCPDTWFDLGGKCISPLQTSATPKNAIDNCFSKGGEICNSQTISYTCNRASAIGYTFPENEWLWNGDQEYIYWSPGNYYISYEVQRKLSGLCYNEAGQRANPSTTVLSWDYGDVSYRYACCASPLPLERGDLGR